MEASKLSESSRAAVLHQASQLLSWRPHGMPMAFGFGTSVCGSTWVRALVVFVPHPCLQSLLHSRSRAGAGAFSELRSLGGGAGGWSSEVGGDIPGSLLKSSRPRVPDCRPSLPPLSGVSRGPEGADLQCASLYASYLLRSRCPSQCTGVRAPGVWSAEPRGLSAPETSNLGAADRACGRPPGPPLGRAGWSGAPKRGSGSPGRAPPAGVSMSFARRSRPEGGSRLGCGLVPGPASLPESRRHSRAPDF
ncbi:hypothetical protein NDU88_003892 [Pleurodeles waltl]|uniref:Uncharacterized protein n=1 Tax=Pleurodeles waltl TaxID=8319 RepID=A0AAV7KYB1_PLEWA|nr:hypothetical protein NDU88_003892 [Pleurodeles waltl]